jgi:hypothetical protein
MEYKSALIATGNLASVGDINENSGAILESNSRNIAS